jgi:hypothetical protein
VFFFHNSAQFKEFSVGSRWLFTLYSFLMQCCRYLCIFHGEYVLRMVLCVHVHLAVGTAVCFEGVGIGFRVVDRV